MTVFTMFNGIYLMPLNFFCSEQYSPFQNVQIFWSAVMWEQFMGDLEENGCLIFLLFFFFFCTFHRNYHVIFLFFLVFLFSTIAFILMFPGTSLTHIWLYWCSQKRPRMPKRWPRGVECISVLKIYCLRCNQ